MDEAITEVSICNSALIKLGAEQIQSLSDDTKNARLCAARYAMIRNKVLEDHPWAFATKTVSLTSLAGVTPRDWTYAFAYPADFLKMIMSTDWDSEYDTIDNQLVADDPEIVIKYIYKNTNPATYTYAFAECLSWRIAADLAYAITNSKEVAGLMIQGYQADLSAARYNDAHKKSPEGPYADTWIDARF